MHPFISKYFLYIPVQYFRKEKVLSHLKEFEQTQWLSANDLKKWQRDKLKQLMTHAYQNSPYYRRQFELLNLSPDCLSDSKAINSLPVLTKQLYRDNISEIIVQNGKTNLDMKRTSGSSGIPLEIYKDRDSLALNRAVMYRFYGWYNIKIGDKQARVLGHPTTFMSKLKEDVQDIILNKTRLDPVFLTEKNLISYFRRLKRIKPKYIYGYPSAIYEFGKFLTKKSFDPSNLNIPVIITTGEILHPFQREFIERSFRSTLVNEYGCSECGIIAFQCPHGKMHLSTDNLYVEVIKDGVPAEPGEAGEVVVTELFNYSAPLIRYKVGDLVKLSSDKKCSCGRNFPIIDSVEGRTSQLIHLANGQKIHTEIFHYISDAISENGGGIKHFKVIQKRESEFHVEILLDENYTKDTEDYLKSEFKRFLGEDIILKIREVDEISRDKSGKIRYFVSELKRD